MYKTRRVGWFQLQVTRYHWNDPREGPGSGPRTSSECGRRLGSLRRKKSPSGRRVWTRLDEISGAYLRGWRRTHGGPGSPSARGSRGALSRLRLRRWSLNRAPSWCWPPWPRRQSRGPGPRPYSPESEPGRSCVHAHHRVFPAQSEPISHLFSLHHLLVEEVGERALWIELPGALGAHEHAVLTHQPPSADGDQRNAVAAHPLVQVKVSALHLSAHRDGPGGRQSNRSTG